MTAGRHVCNDCDLDAGHDGAHWLAGAQPTLTERAIAAQLVDECTRGENVHVGDLAGHLADFLAAQRVAIHARYEAVADALWAKAGDHRRAAVATNDDDTALQLVTRHDQCIADARAIRQVATQ